MNPPRAGWLTAGAIALAGASAAATKIHSNDLWWHLATGRWIAGSLSIPREEFFSFTSAGTPWTDHGWLWQLFAWFLYQIGGLYGLIALKMACASVMAVAGLATLRRAGWGHHAASGLMILVLTGARFRFLDRPETLGLALLALFLYAISATGLVWNRRIFIIVPVCILWANSHASALLAPALAIAVASGSLIGGVRARIGNHPDAGRLLKHSGESALLAGVAGLCLLVNPYGWSIFEVPWQIRKVFETNTLVNPEWLPPQVITFPLFYGLLAALLFLGARRIFSRAVPDTWRGFLLLCGAAFLALRSTRHLGLFFCTVPFAIALAGRPFEGRPRGSSRKRLPWNLVPSGWAPVWGILAAGIFPLIASPPVPAPGFGVAEGRFPDKEADYIHENLSPARRLFNDVAHGGFLIWRFYPESEVFIDGRNELHGPLLADLAAAVDDGRLWQSLLDKHRIDSVLVKYRVELIGIAGEGPGGRRSFAALHFARRFWALVYWGDAGMVYLRRDAGLDDLIARDEYEFIHPEDWVHQLEQCRGEGDPVLCAGIRADISRRLAEPNPPVRARELRRRFESAHSD